jgi:hypothetical protein
MPLLDERGNPAFTKYFVALGKETVFIYAIYKTNNPSRVPLGFITPEGTK